MRVEYENDKKTAYFDDMKFTLDKKTGYYLSTRKVDGRRVRLHVYVWSYFNGAVPDGYQVHHKDEDKGNNDIDNLDCLTLHDHLSYHSRSDEQLKRLKNNHSACVEASKKWHKSDAGHEWHKKQYEKYGHLMYVQQEFVCEYCGKKFTSTKAGSKYCCNSHKAYDRRRKGLDNVEAVCAVCGKTFVKNKYEKTKTCGRECRKILFKATRWEK